MTAPKFTAADVVVGATVHIRKTSAYGPRTTHEEFVGTVEEVAGFHRDARIKGTDGGSAWVKVAPEPDEIVEILGVVPPKPKYVVGGIYRVTSRGGREVLRKRFKDGWGRVDSLELKWSDADYARWGGYTFGGRVLVIDYPADTFPGRFLTDEDRAWWARLIDKGLSAESARGVKS